MQKKVPLIFTNEFFSLSSQILFKVMMGEATAYQLNAFIKTPSARGTFFKPKYTLVPFSMDKLTLPEQVEGVQVGFRQEIVHELVPIGQIPQRGVFPYVFIMDYDEDKRKQDIQRAMVSNDVNSHTVLVGTGRAESGSTPGSWDYDGAGVNMTTSGCECFVISRQELIALVGDTEKLRAILNEQKTMTPVVDRAVQQGFLSSRGWLML